MDARAILIVGASGSIGSAAAAQLARPGIALGLHFRSNRAAAERLAERLAESGYACNCLQSDLASERACAELVDTFARHGSGIYGLVLCGGTVPRKHWQQLDGAAWQEILFEHCVAPFALARAAIAHMRLTGHGRIAFLSSIAPDYGGSPHTLHYAAAKGALEVAMRGLAREVAAEGIRINGVRAGFVHSSQHRHRPAAEISERIGRIPVGRAGTADEVASALVYLLSDHASFVHGELITVAGGD